MQGYPLSSCLVYLAFDFIPNFQLRILSMMNNNPVNFLYVVDSKAFNLSVIRLLPPTPWIESCSVQDNCPVLKNLYYLCIELEDILVIECKCFRQTFHILPFLLHSFALMLPCHLRIEV